MSSDNSTPITAAQSSRRGMVVAWAGVSLTLPSTKVTCTSPVGWIVLRYETAPMAFSEASQKVWSSVHAVVRRGLSL